MRSHMQAEMGIETMKHIMLSRSFLSSFIQQDLRAVVYFAMLEVMWWNNAK